MRGGVFRKLFIRAKDDAATSLDEIRSVDGMNGLSLARLAINMPFPLSCDPKRNNGFVNERTSGWNRVASHRNAGTPDYVLRGLSRRFVMNTDDVLTPRAGGQETCGTTTMYVGTHSHQGTNRPNTYQLATTRTVRPIHTQFSAGLADP